MESVIDEKIRRFLAVEETDGSGSGYGSGYGDGDGYGYGDGDGYGYGYGDGDGSGDGSGSGSGSGDGSGSGSGDGYGYGSGSGSGDGYGSGSGSGYGVKSMDGEIFYSIDRTPTSIDRVRGNIAKGHILRVDLTLEPCYIVKGGRFFAHGKTIREAQEALQEKLLEGMSEEERVDAFLSEFKPNIEYTAKEFYDWHHRLTGSCEFGRNAFAKDHGIDVEHDTMTVQRFIELTENAFGGNVIRMVKERLEAKI